MPIHHTGSTWLAETQIPELAEINSNDEFEGVLIERHIFDRMWQPVYYRRGRATAPLEEDIIKLVQQSGLVFIDETGWKENGCLVWLWVLRTTTATLYLIGRRSWDVTADIMEHFAGWLMSDGYGQYRNYSKRLRCLAHLIRKGAATG